MALRCVLAHLIRSPTSLRLLKPAAHPAKAPASPFAGLSGKITDEFIGAGAIGQVCQVDGTEALGRGQRVLNTGSPITDATSAADAFPPAFPPFAGHEHTRDYAYSDSDSDGDVVTGPEGDPYYNSSDYDFGPEIELSDDFLSADDEDEDEEVIGGAYEELPK